MGIWFGLATALSWSIGIFPFTGASKAFGANTVNTVRLLLAALSLGLICVYFSDISPSALFLKPGFRAWFWLGLSGLVGLSLGDYFSFRAFTRLGARRSSVFSTLAPGAALVLAFVVHGSIPGWMELLGMMVTLGGVFLLLQTQSKTEKEGEMNTGGISDAVMAALCQGAGLVFSKMGMETVHALEPVHAAFMRMFCGGAVLYLISIASGSFRSLHMRVLKGDKRAQALLLSGTFFGPVLGNTLAMITVKHLTAPVAQTIFSLVPILAIPLSAWFYKEKIKPEMIWPALLAFTGVVILVMS